MTKQEFHVMGVDLGTSSIRASLVNLDLEIVHQVRQPVDLETDPLGKAVQDPIAILGAALDCIDETVQWAEADGCAVQALCFSNAIASLVCLDADYQPLRPALTYADLRAHREADRLVQDYGRPFFSRTAAPMHASYWLPKYLWLQNQGFSLGDVRYFCTLKDLVIHRLTGRFITDFSNAVATGMCNALTGDWDARLLKIAGISHDQLPQIFPTTSIHNPLPTAGLPKGVRIVLGAMDGVLSSLGAGAFRPGQVTTMIGSSGACRIAAESPLTDERATRIWSYPLDDKIWIRGGAMNSGGLVTQWLVQQFAGGDHAEDYDRMFAAAAQVAPGAEGLLFLPYLFGERSPIWDESARGAYFGLHSGHQRAHLARAGIEGILFALYSIFEVIRPEAAEVVDIRATGGYLRASLMLQIQADLFGQPVSIPANFEGSTLGAAALALSALGQIEGYEALGGALRVAKTYQPDAAKTPHYQAAFRRFKALYAQLSSLFAADDAA